MKVIHFLSTFNFGGIGKLVFDLTSKQKLNQNITLSLLILKNYGHFKNMFAALEIDITEINPKSTYQFSFNKFKQIFKIFSAADIIHLHGFHIFIAILAVLTKTKIIYTEHGNFAFGCKKHFKDTISHFLRRYFYKHHFDFIACNSKFTERYLNENWGIREESIGVIYNGINTHQVIDSDNVATIKSLQSNNFIVGTVSRLAGVKRIDRLVNAFRVFSINKDNVTLVIVGEGPERESLMQLIKDYDLDNVVFMGYRSNVLDYMSAFNVCVFPSQNETFGLVAVEAYSQEKPVIVFSDGGGLIEIVDRCDTEDIVDTIDDLAERMDYYYHTKINEKNVTDILSYFTAERMEKDYFREYEKLLCAE